MKTDLRIGIVRVELKHVNSAVRRILDDTMAVFRDASSYLVHVACDHHNELRLMSSYDRLTYMESLTHRTKENPEPEYTHFDILFRKLPSYIRRAAIHAAVGHVQSHDTRCDQYYEYREEIISRGHHFTKMEPGFTYTPSVCPTLYKDQSFLMNDNGCVEVKVFIRNTWEWITLSVPNRDMKHLREAVKKGTLKNPKLVKEYGKYYLEFPVVYKKKEHPDVPLDEQLVLGVDLGLNNGAVCSLVDSRGTVHGRWFSPFKEDMDRIDHVINLIRKKASTSGKGQSLSHLYTKLKGLKDNYVKQLSRWITNIAIREGAYGIVLEHLGKMKGRGKLAARTHHWCTAKICDYIQGMAYREGIRVFIINPKNTSALAFDGSGPVQRESSNYSICTFTSGKVYNCDLSASYNIAARYFLRALMKSTSATKWSELAAKVPGLMKRTNWVLDTLRRAQQVLHPEKQLAVKDTEPVHSPAAMSA